MSVQSPPLMTLLARWWSHAAASHAAGVPSLLDALLPGKALLSQRLWLRNLLLLPPPPAVASAIHNACELLLGLTVPLPTFPVMTMHTIAMKLLYREASDAFFRDLRTVLAALDATVREPKLTPACGSAHGSHEPSTLRRPEVWTALYKIAGTFIGASLCLEQSKSSQRDMFCR